MKRVGKKLHREDVLLRLPAPGHAVLGEGLWHLAERRQRRVRLGAGRGDRRVEISFVVVVDEQPSSIDSCRVLCRRRREGPDPLPRRAARGRRRAGRAQRREGRQGACALFFLALKKESNWTLLFRRNARNANLLSLLLDPTPTKTHRSRSSSSRQGGQEEEQQRQDQQLQEQQEASKSRSSWRCPPLPPPSRPLREHLPRSATEEQQQRQWRAPPSLVVLLSLLLLCSLPQSSATPSPLRRSLPKGSPN